jgi:arylsulfatase A-like enzyme
MVEQKKPNILLIVVDDVGWFDVGAYHRGIMGAPTPNIDRIAHEGAVLTDCCAKPVAQLAAPPSLPASFRSGQV